MNKIKTLEHKQHVLERPNMYIGSTEIIQNKKCLVYDNESKNIVEKKLSVCSGILQLINEILQNSRDHVIRDPNCNIIKMTRNEKIISVENNGNGIPAEDV